MSAVPTSSALDSISIANTAEKAHQLLRCCERFPPDEGHYPESAEFDLPDSSRATTGSSELQGSQESSGTDSDILEFAKRQLSRFELWASNIGVFASRHASLDYRLRTAPIAKVVVDGNLNTLCKHTLCGMN